MIIEIESAYGDKQLVGKTMFFEDLKIIVKEILKEHNEISFVSEFCSRCGYKEIPFSSVYSSYTIDLDTHLVFANEFTFPNELDGAKVLFATDRRNFDPICYPDGTVAHNVAYLAICKYDNDGSYYIFHCDECLEVVADDCFESFEACKELINNKVKENSHDI